MQTVEHGLSSFLHSLVHELRIKMLKRREMLAVNTPTA